MSALVKLHCCVDEPGKWQLKAISYTSKFLRVQNAAVAVLVDLGSILPFATPTQEFYVE